MMTTSLLVVNCTLRWRRQSCEINIPMEKKFEQSYIDMLGGLFQAVSTNSTIPMKDHKTIVNKINKLEMLLEKYGA